MTTDNRLQVVSRAWLAEMSRYDEGVSTARQVNFGVHTQIADRGFHVFAVFARASHRRAHQPFHGCVCIELGTSGVVAAFGMSAPVRATYALRGNVVRRESTVDQRFGREQRQADGTRVYRFAVLLLSAQPRVASFG